MIWGFGGNSLLHPLQNPAFWATLSDTRLGVRSIKPGVFLNRRWFRLALGGSGSPALFGRDDHGKSTDDRWWIQRFG